MSQKGRGILAYFFGWIGGLIVLLAMDDNTRNTRIHAAQAITLAVATIVIGMVAPFIPFIGGLVSTAVSIANIVLWIMGLSKVCKEAEDPKLPIIGDLTMKLFASKIGPEEEASVNPIETNEGSINDNQENL